MTDGLSLNHDQENVLRLETTLQYTSQPRVTGRSVKPLECVNKGAYNP